MLCDLSGTLNWFPSTSGWLRPQYVGHLPMKEEATGPVKDWLAQLRLL